MSNFDLHIHSEFSSDGEFTISEIVNRCIENQINIFSITDHNSVKGIDEAHSLAAKKELGFISGIEIDCNYKGTNLHVLGYNINWKSNDFPKLEEEVFCKIMVSFDEMISNLNKLGFIIDKESVLAKAGDKLPTGELIAEVMLADEKFHTPLLLPYMKGGNRSDMPYINFYLDYFAQGKPAFVPVKFMDYTNTIEMIRENGGTAIIAHPGLNFKGKEQIVEELLEKGAEGLEVFNNYHNMEQIDYFASVIQKRKNIMTCGSDFHGKIKPLINIGQFNFNKKYEEYLNNSIYALK